MVLSVQTGSEKEKMIFIDTSAFVALRNPADPNHKKALKFSLKLEAAQSQLLTSNYVLAETYTVISQKVGKPQAISFKEDFDPSIQITRVDENLEEVAWKIFKDIRSKNVSFIDCTSFAVMRNLSIKHVFAFDDDFKRLGFSLLT